MVKNIMPERDVEPFMVTRFIFRCFHQVLLGGGDFPAAYSDLVEDYQLAYQKTGSSRRRAELGVYRSMAEAMDEDTKLAFRLLFKTVYVIARIFA